MKSMEIRSSEITTSGAGTLTGYVVRWDKLSELLWGGVLRKIPAGGRLLSGLRRVMTFAACMSMTTACYWGRTRSGTLKLEEDDTGLRFELTPTGYQHRA
ncbi:HK97 family phage prohead protease [Escherichia coli]|nr:HK97 family phage prohead protease [Escherichia coli]